MNQSSRTIAFLAYALSLFGALYVILARRSDRFALYHACQSLALLAGILIAPVVWALIAWLTAWIPSVGPLLAVALFSLVIACFLALAFAWVRGMIAALRGETHAALLVGSLGRRLFQGLTPAADSIPPVV